MRTNSPLYILGWIIVALIAIIVILKLLNHF
jgi:hypothetical protein